MIYLALDQALQTTGWAAFDGDKLIKYGHFVVPANKPIEKRLQGFIRKLIELEQELHFDLDFLFFEDIQAQQNKETYKKLAYVQAAIILWCCFVEIPFDILPPSHWRKILKDKYKINFGKSRAEQKKAAQELVRQEFGIEATEDECDAICIGLAGLIERTKKDSAF